MKYPLFDVRQLQLDFALVQGGSLAAALAYW